MSKDLPLSDRFLSLERDIEEYKPRSPEEILNLSRQYFTLTRRGDTRSFNYKDWYGIITLKRNYYMGSIFSRYKDKPLVIRGYPKIKYASETGLLGKIVDFERKYDGTNLGIYLLPDNKVICKTRMKERGDRIGYEGKVWMDLLEKVPCFKGLCSLVREGYIVFGELYGKLNPGEFIRYSTEIDLKVFDMVDHTSFTFLSRKHKEDICSKYEVPIVEIEASGTLSMDLISRLEESLKDMLKMDGSEGLVAKYWDNDLFMAKLKPEPVKERCWEKSRTTIPTSIILKAIRKAKENIYSFSTKEELEQMLKDELLEEVSEDLVKKSWKKILRLLYMETEESREEEVKAALEGISSQSLKDKRKAMNYLADRFPDIKPSRLFQLYCSYLISLKEGGDKKNGEDYQASPSQP